MFRVNRILAIIALFFFAVSMGSCGGGGGGSSSGGGTPPPPVTEPTPPPPQTSTTDNTGQASFTTSQNQNVTFEVKDKDTQQALPNITVTFADVQNNNIITTVTDLNGEYAYGIYTGSLQSTDSAKTIRSSNLSFKEIILKIPPISSFYKIYGHIKGVDYLEKLGGGNLIIMKIQYAIDL